MDKPKEQEHFEASEENMISNPSKYSVGDVIHILSSNQLGSKSYVKIKDGFKEIMLSEK
jgi:hypothetical protein